MLPTFDPWLASSVSADVSVASRADPAGLAARQRRRLTDLLAAAARGSSLYRRILGGRDPAAVNLVDLPVMRKTELMQQFEDWVTDPELKLDELRRFAADPSRIGEPFLDRYVVWESSGSSGEPGVFVQDAPAMAVYDALEALRRPVLQPVERWLDPWLLGERIVFVGAIEGHFASIVSIERLRRLNPALAARHSQRFVPAADRHPGVATAGAAADHHLDLSERCRAAGRGAPCRAARCLAAGGLDGRRRPLARGAPGHRAGPGLPGGQQLWRLGIPVACLRMRSRPPASEQRLGDPRGSR